MKYLLTKISQTKLVVALKRLLYGEKGDFEKQVLELQEQIKRKDNKIEGLEFENKTATQLYKDIDQERIKIKTERDELRVKVREQTAGDLLYNAIKAINAPKEEQPKYYENHRNLLAQYNQMRQWDRLQSNFDSLGLGGLLGGLWQQQPQPFSSI